MTMAASACTNIAFWMPGPAKEETSTEQQQESSSEANNEAENWTAEGPSLQRRPFREVGQYFFAFVNN
jgi:hypothetical protein